VGGGFIKSVRERLIVVHQSRGAGWKTIKKMFDFDPTLSTILEMGTGELVKSLEMKQYFAEMFYQDCHKFTYEQITNHYAQRNTHIITIFDPEYPEQLKEIYDPPWVLYCKGNLQYLKYPKMLSVVGTRDPSPYGIECMNKILPSLIAADWLIVSGLAYGIDINAHRLAMREKGKTIAVLGSGIEYVYPSQHKEIANEIAANHLLISEYPINQKPQKWQFPLRNRIISGLTRGTLVIEAKEKSGSFITADQALQQGREVFAIPGSILEPRSVGTNALIQLGAKLVKSTEDIENELQFYT
jgi:DNA processing protein